MHRAKIQLLEDNLIVLDALAEELALENYDIVAKDDNLSDAKLSFLKYQPNICIVDIELGDDKEDGIHFANWIPKESACSFIFLTSHGKKAIREKALVTKPANYLLKPYNLTQLLAAIELALQNNTNAQSFIGSQSCWIQEGKTKSQLKLEEIVWLNADNNSCYIQLINEKKIFNLTLKDVLKQINSPKIIQIHRSWACNEIWISKIRASEVELKWKDNERIIGIGERFKGNLP